MLDQDVLKRARAGDEQARSQLLAEVGDRLGQRVARLLRPEDAEDIVQEAWLVVFHGEGGPNSTDHDGIVGWIVGIARNLALRRAQKLSAERQRAGSRNHRSASPDEEDAGPDPLDEQADQSAGSPQEDAGPDPLDESADRSAERDGAPAFDVTDARATEQRPSSEPMRARTVRTLWLVPRTFGGVIEASSSCVVRTWDEVDSNAESTARTLGTFDLIVLGPVHITDPGQRAPGRDRPRPAPARETADPRPAPTRPPRGPVLQRLGTLAWALGETKRRRAVLTVLLPGRDEGTKLTPYADQTPWTLRGITRELLAWAGWKFDSRPKVCDEGVVVAPGFEAWSCHIQERDDTIVAPDLGAAWIGYQHGGVSAGWFRWGRARVAVLPIDCQRELDASDFRFVQDTTAALLDVREAVPVVADLRLAPQGSASAFVYFAEDMARECRLQRKEAAFVRAFLEELRFGGVPRVPDHLIQARLERDYPGTKPSSMRAKVNEKLAEAFAAWGFAPYDLFASGNGCTALTYPYHEQFRNVLGVEPG